MNVPDPNILYPEKVYTNVIIDIPNILKDDREPYV